MTSTEFRNIYIGQVWSVRDHYRQHRRYVQVTNTTEFVNDPAEAGERVAVVNLATGRRTYMQASTLRAYWRFETEAEA